MKAINDDIEDEIANFYSQEAHQEKIQIFWKKTVKNIYLDVVQNMKIKYGMLLEEAGQNIQDPKQKVLCENFLQNPDLFKGNQNFLLKPTRLLCVSPVGVLS